MPAHAISPVAADTDRYYRQQDRQQRIADGMQRRRDTLRDEFDSKDLYDCLGDDEDLLSDLCEALLPLVAMDTWKIQHPTLRGIAEALQKITERAIANQVARELAA